MNQTRRGLFCSWIQNEYPDLYNQCRNILDNDMTSFPVAGQGVYKCDTRYVVDTESMVYIISQKVCYPHTPELQMFYNKSHKKQKKYVRKLYDYIKENPEVTKFCLL